MFWGVMAIIWIWDAITGYTTFERTHKYDILSYVLLAMPFIYPLVSLARGLSFPEMTSPVMPCSVVVFTIGLLLLFAHKVNMFLPHSGRFPVGKCHNSRPVSFLQRIFPEQSACRHQAESQIYQLAIDKRLHRTGCVADYYHVFRISSEELI